VLIVDSQVHVWANGDSTGAHRRKPVTRDVLSAEMQAAGVARAVLAPPAWDPGGNAYALSLAQAEPDRFAVMGLLVPGGADTAERLRTWFGHAGMRGVRMLFNRAERIAPLLAGRLDPAWEVAEELGLVVSMRVPGSVQVVDDIARRHPGLRILVDRLGVPRGAMGPAAFDHLPSLLALAAHPNVHVKVDGIGDYALDRYPFRSLDATLRRVFDAFGPRRVLWGSDFSRLHHRYRQCVSHFQDALPWLSAPDLEQVMGGNALRLLDWH
jgi:L-fuconolactonase